MNILFISPEKPPYYPQLNNNYNWVPVHGELTFEKLSEIWYDHQPVSVYTFGHEPKTWDVLSKLFQIRKQWVHLAHLPESLSVDSNVYCNVYGHPAQDGHPLVSIITSAYNSGHRIMRPFESLRNQSYQDWEWIIWDDSKDDKTFAELVELQKRDLRIRVYKASHNSGYIGNMKRLCCDVAYGQFVVELDHDDDLHPDLLKWLVDASRQYPDAQFFYCDTAELDEVTYKPATYGDFFAFGYSVHYNVWSDLHRQYVAGAVAPWPNAKSLSHIVGVPNHVRAWKRDFYRQIGGHNPLLKVADDYDLVLKSYLHGKWCHIRACGYYQYRNTTGNTTFTHNRLIQHNTSHVYDHYRRKLPAIKSDVPVQPGWKYDGWPYEKTHYEYVPPEYRYTQCIGLINPDEKQLLAELEQLKTSQHIFIIGELPVGLNAEQARQVTWWKLSSNDRADAIRYITKFLHTSGDLVIR